MHVCGVRFQQDFLCALNLYGSQLLPVFAHAVNRRAYVFSQCAATFSANTAERGVVGGALLLM